MTKESHTYTTWLTGHLTILKVKVI